VVDSRAKEIAHEEVLNQTKKAEVRDKKDKMRYHRLLDAYRRRADYRNDLSGRINAKNTGFDESQSKMQEQAAMSKFLMDLRIQEKRDNVERIARMNEFRRLQILRRIQGDDEKYNHIQEQKASMDSNHKQEVQMSLIRKHEVINAMETMRTTNDFTLLDKLFESKKKRLEEERRQNDEEEEQRL
jgi:hypothetical protein